LDDAEIERWLERVKVGNAYVNRGITGAVVRRQPFGGWKRSSVGCGPKAGGPDYVAEMVTGRPVPLALADIDLPYRGVWMEWFAGAHDPTGLTSERNELRYRPLRGVLLRVGSDTPHGVAAAARLAAELCGTPLVLSDSSAETAEALIARLPSLGVERMRLLTDAPVELREACWSNGIEIDTEPVSPSGRRELRRWLREQAVSRTVHRHGRVAP
jgi:RHH-type proline utilization regulon transcriptional repressor/proline dehydrogenase/delta 1-pyrroline-5-carboxylate dehydrogenase